MAVVPIARAHPVPAPSAFTIPTPVSTRDAIAAVPTGEYQPNYRDGMDCPGCGRGAFHIGRQSAECANCGTALPLAPTRGAR